MENPNDIQMSAPVEDKVQAVPGGFWRRFAALIIDVVVLYILQIPFSKLLVSVLGVDQSIYDKIAQGHIPQEFIVFQTYSFVIGLGVSYFYYLFCYQWKRASLGKLALDLEVLVLKNGKAPSYLEVFLRETIGKPVSAFLLMIGYMIAIFRADGRGLHDLIAGTQVIRRKQD